MRIQHYPDTLSREDQLMLNIILDVEVEIQVWAAVAYSRLLREELRIGLQ